MKEFFVLALMIFAPLSFGCVEPWALSLALAVIFALFANTLYKRNKFYFSPVCKTVTPAVIFIFALGLVQSMTQIAITDPSPFYPFTLWRADTLQNSVLWAGYGAFMFCTTQVFEEKKQIKRALFVIFSAGIFIALLGILQKHGSTSLVYGLRKVSGNVFGPFVNRDNAASYLSLAAFCGMGLFFSRLLRLPKLRVTTEKFDFFAVQTLLAVMVFIIVYGIIKTGSRGALNGALISLTAVLSVSVFKYVKKTYVKIILSAVIIAGIVGYAKFVTLNPKFIAVNNDFSFENTAKVRLSLYKSSLAMIKDFPVFGVGLGAMEYGFSRYQDDDIARGFVAQAHNDYLDIALQTGIVGLIAFALGIFGFLYKVIKRISAVRSKEDAVLMLFVLGAGVSFLLHAFVDFPLQIPANAITFYFLIALLGSKAFAENSNESALIIKKHWRIIGRVLSLLFVLATLPAAVANYYEISAKSEERVFRPVYFNKAMRLYPSPVTAYKIGTTYYNLALKYPAKNKQYFENALSAVNSVYYKCPTAELDKLRRSVIFAQSAK